MFENAVTLAPALRKPPHPASKRKVPVPAGLAAGTHIRTVTGPRRIETLMAGDLLLDIDDQIVEIRSVRKFTVQGDELVRIAPSTFGARASHNPADTLLVTQDQKLAVQDWRSHIIFGKPVLSPADTLVDGIQVCTVRVKNMQFCALSFDTPTVIEANGIYALASA